jgi:Rod binding domain-containing protein
MSLEAGILPTIGQSVQLVREASPVREPAKESPARISHAATDFEALLLGHMLKTAREAGEGDDEEKDPDSALIEFGEQQFAQVLASSGGFGIAKMVVAGLTKHAD